MTASKPFKLGAREGEAWVEHAHSHAFRREPCAGGERLVAAPHADQIGLLIELSRQLPDPFHVLYVLLASRRLRPEGRYQGTQPVGRGALETFLGRFRTFLEQDGRHHLWIIAPEAGATLVYDHHQVLYAYGPLDEYERVLRSAGMDEGAVFIPDEHQHRHHPDMDDEEDRLMGHWPWTWFPLEPEDDPAE